MPIRAELRHHYGPEWRSVTRPRILERAGKRCENCKKPDRAIVETVTGKTPTGVYFMYWRFPGRLLQPANEKGRGGPWVNWKGLTLAHIADTLELRRRDITVVLTVAHLNHEAGDDRDENLRALCQWCHLIHDLEHHHATRGARKDEGRALLSLLNVEHAQTTQG